MFRKAYKNIWTLFAVNRRHLVAGVCWLRFHVGILILTTSPLMRRCNQICFYTIWFFFFFFRSGCNTSGAGSHGGRRMCTPPEKGWRAAAGHSAPLPSGKVPGTEHVQVCSQAVHGGSQVLKKQHTEKAKHTLCPPLLLSPFVVS